MCFLVLLSGRKNINGQLSKVDKTTDHSGQQNSYLSLDSVIFRCLQTGLLLTFQVTCLFLPRKVSSSNSSV